MKTVNFISNNLFFIFALDFNIVWTITSSEFLDVGDRCWWQIFVTDFGGRCWRLIWATLALNISKTLTRQEFCRQHQIIPDKLYSIASTSMLVTGCWRQFLLLASLRCWWPIWDHWPTFTLKLSSTEWFCHKNFRKHNFVINITLTVIKLFLTVINFTEVISGKVKKFSD